MTVAAPSQGRSRRTWNRLEYDERRDQILATARSLFAERPYGSVSTIQIAEAAGVTRGLLHHYFGTKRSLYLAVVEELVGGPVLELLEAMNASSPDGLLVTRTWEDSVELWMDVVEANRAGWLLAISAGETGQDRAMQDILDQARERTASQVVGVLGLDDKRTPEVRALVRAFGSFAEEVTRQWLQERRLSREQARVLLAGSLPLMVDKLLPDVVATRGARKSARTARSRRRAALT
jgi:AcrR family transcriptional regulator